MTDRHEKKRATMAANLEARSGLSVADWVALVDTAGVAGFSAVVSWLKGHHDLGHFQARLIAEAHRDSKA